MLALNLFRRLQFLNILFPTGVTESLFLRLADIDECGIMLNVVNRP